MFEICVGIFNTSSSFNIIWQNYFCGILEILWDLLKYCLLGFLTRTGRPAVYRQSTVSVSGWSGRPDQSTGVLAECTYPCACLSVDRLSTDSRPKYYFESQSGISRPERSTDSFVLLTVFISRPDRSTDSS